jgi:hypothetical protein
MIHPNFCSDKKIPTANMDIEVVMQRLQASEIDCSLTAFWDGGWTVKIGDPTKNFMAEGNFRTLDEGAEFLDRQARRNCPESAYSLGKLEYKIVSSNPK